MVGSCENAGVNGNPAPGHAVFTCMFSEDRFGLKGHPDVQAARRVRFGTGSIAILLLIILAFYGFGTLLSAEGWPGRVGGLLGLGGALAGAWQ